jgi:hypothetical protein
VSVRVPVRIAVTVCDCSHVIHAGGDPQRTTSVIELNDDQVPLILRQHLEAVAKSKQKTGSYGGGYLYETVALSLIE